MSVKNTRTLNGCFTPAAAALPNAILPGQVTCRDRAQGMGG